MSELDDPGAADDAERSGEGRTGEVVAWRAWWLGSLARSHPTRLFAALAMLAAAAVAGVVLLPPLAGAVLLVAVVLSLDQVLLPIAFRIDERGIRTRTALRTRRFEWGEFTRARRTEHGVLLASPIRRSLHLLTADAGEEIAALCARRLGTTDDG